MSGTGGPTEAGAGHAFAVECPGCRAHVAVAAVLAGREAACPLCHAVFVVPAPPAAAPPTTTPSVATPPAAAPPVPAVARPVDAASVPVAPHRDRPQATDRPHASEGVAAADEPIIFAEPPPPRTRRRADEPWSNVAADATVARPTDGGVSLPAPLPATDEGVPGGLAFREPVKKVRSGGTEIELRRLTPEERRVRRARRNLIMLVVGAALLVALVVMLGKGGR